MNARSILLIMVAVCVGVFAALQADRFVNGRRVPVYGAPALIPAPSASIVPAALDQSSPTGLLDFRSAAKKVIPSVVSVDRYEEMRDFFDEPVGQVRETGTGSGVVLSRDGVIVTNNHVVTDEAGNPVNEIKVRLHDGRSFVAQVLGRDQMSDIAVLRVKASNLTPIELGVSGNLEIGQWVMAVGNPLGFDDTVSVGVVSSLRRNLPVGQSGLVGAIQTDAAINPGNSGGALTDQLGRLVGINAAIASGNGGSVGIGFAIPVDRVRGVVNDIITYGHARHGSLGVSYSPRLEGALSDPDNREAIAEKVGASPSNVPSKGVIVVGVAGPAARLGMKPWDILLSIDDVETSNSFDFSRALISKKPGDTAKVKWWSAGQVHTATTTLQETGGDIQ
jgi:S1-C subfamily serine protease